MLNLILVRKDAYLTILAFWGINIFDIVFSRYLRLYVLLYYIAITHIRKNGSHGIQFHYVMAFIKLQKLLKSCVFRLYSAIYQLFTAFRATLAFRNSVMVIAIGPKLSVCCHLQAYIRNMYYSGMYLFQFPRYMLTKNMHDDILKLRTRFV